MNTVEERLQEIFRDVLGREDFTLDKELNINEIEGMDSLTHVTLMGAIQDEFEIQFSIEEMLRLETVGEIVSSIEEKTER